MSDPSGNTPEPDKKPEPKKSSGYENADKSLDTANRAAWYGNDKVADMAMEQHRVEMERANKKTSP